MGDLAPQGIIIITIVNYYYYCSYFLTVVIAISATAYHTST